MNIKRNILLNPGPATTTDSVKMAQIVPDICPREKEFTALMKKMREDLVKVVHGGDDYTAVPFCGSGTICMDVCLNSLLPDGKRILIVNNGEYSARAEEICKSYGILHSVLRLPYDKPASLKEIEGYLMFNPSTKVVYVTHHETGSGILNPIREIGAIAHKYGAIMVTDTTSTYAMRPINVYEDNIDFCMASAQKGLMSMTGLSFVIGRTDLIKKSAEYKKRSYYCNLFMQYDYFEKTGQMHFTPPVQTVYATVQALKEYFDEGENEKWARHLRVYNEIRKGIKEIGFKCLLDEKDEAGLVVSVLYPEDENWDFMKVHDYCYERGFTIYPGKFSGFDTFRLCALGAIDANDIKDFFKVFKDALREYGVKFNEQ